MPFDIPDLSYQSEKICTYNIPDLMGQSSYRHYNPFDDPSWKDSQPKAPTLVTGHSYLDVSDIPHTSNDCWSVLAFAAQNCSSKGEIRFPR